MAEDQDRNLPKMKITTMLQSLLVDNRAVFRMLEQGGADQSEALCEHSDNVYKALSNCKSLANSPFPFALTVSSFPPMC
jgi:hypothetical protein